MHNSCEQTKGKFDAERIVGFFLLQKEKRKCQVSIAMICEHFKFVQSLGSSVWLSTFHALFLDLELTKNTFALLALAKIKRKTG